MHHVGHSGMDQAVQHTIFFLSPAGRIDRNLPFEHNVGDVVNRISRTMDSKNTA